MSSHRLPLIATAMGLLLLLASATVSVGSEHGIQGGAIDATALGVPSRLVVFLPETVYVDHPFDIPVWIADEGRQLVKDGTSAVVTLTVDGGPMAGPGAVLTCPGGVSARSPETGPNAGLAFFAGCMALRAGEFTLDATASNIQSTIVPTPVIAPDSDVPLHVLPATEAEQEAIELTAEASGLPYAVIPSGRAITLRIRFTQHGANQPFQVQASPLTTSAWQSVADMQTDADGTASISVRPEVSTWYRVIYAGSPMLAAGRSRLFTAAVRFVATQRPINATPRVIRRGATLRFETTVRPVIAGLPTPKVTFQLWHRVAGTWRLASTRTRPADTSGVARVNIAFAGIGDWYVRSLARSVVASNPAVVPDVWLAALGQSDPTSISRLRVR